MSYEQARAALDEAAKQLAELVPYNWDTRAEKVQLLIRLASAESVIDIPIQNRSLVANPGQLW